MLWASSDPRYSACISSSLRLQSSIRVLRNPNNYTYHSFLTGIWTLPEATSAFAVACFPVLPKFLRGVRDKLRRKDTTTSESFPLPSIVNMKFGRVRDRRFDGNGHASSPESAKIIYSQGWQELEDTRSMINHSRSAEQVQESSRPLGESAAGEESVV